MKKHKNLDKELEVLSSKDENDYELIESSAILNLAANLELVNLETAFTDDNNLLLEEINEVNALYKEIKEDVDSARGIKNLPVNMNGGGDAKTRTRINGYITKQVENLISIKNLKFHLLQQKYVISKNYSELNLKQFLALLRQGKDTKNLGNEALIQLLDMLTKDRSSVPQEGSLEKIASDDTYFDDILDNRISEEKINYEGENVDTTSRKKKKKKYTIVYEKSSGELLAVDNDYNILEDVDLSNVSIVEIEGVYYNEDTGAVIEEVEFT